MHITIERVFAMPDISHLGEIQRLETMMAASFLCVTTALVQIVGKQEMVC